VPFLLERVAGRLRTGARNGLLWFRSRRVVVLGLGPRRLGGVLRRCHLHAGAARFGEADRDRLLGRPRSVLAFLDVLDLLMDELAGLGARGLSLALVFAGLLDGLFLGHGDGLLLFSPECNLWTRGSQRNKSGQRHCGRMLEACSIHFC